MYYYSGVIIVRAPATRTSGIQFLLRLLHALFATGPDILAHPRN